MIHNQQAAIAALTAAQEKSLRAFHRVSHICAGMVAWVWLPGGNETWATATRQIWQKVRPVVAVVEARPCGAVTLSVAVARPSPTSGRLIFRTCGKWDLLLPAIPGGQHSQLNASVSQHRKTTWAGLDLLKSITDFGWATYRGENPVCSPPVFPTVEAGVEDYGPVLGQAVRNPFTDASAVYNERVALSNPASKVLARRGIEVADVEAIDANTLDEIVKEIRAEMAQVDNVVYEDNDIYSALVSPDRAIVGTREFFPGLAYCKAQYDVIRESAHRSERISRTRLHVATDRDLATAALFVHEPLVLSQLGRIQVASADMCQRLPEPYAGDFLAPADWAPRQAPGSEQELAR